jgi:hypothetical protein
MARLFRPVSPLCNKIDAARHSGPGERPISADGGESTDRADLPDQLDEPDLHAAVEPYSDGTRMEHIHRQISPDRSSVLRQGGRAV